MSLFLDPPPAPPAGEVGTLAWLRASAARFSSGDEHARRRKLVDEQLAAVDPAGLRTRVATADVGPDFARRAPVAALAEALGARDDVVDAVLRSRAATGRARRHPARTTRSRCWHASGARTRRRPTGSACWSRRATRRPRWSAAMTHRYPRPAVSSRGG
ncbi:hypothetical protein [Amycolatopsis sacchari]|uniref:hypothetical protein n=1 Tax=Amycolatopsis sacchari TaxID=115433 RepID=UPI003EBD3E44